KPAFRGRIAQGRASVRTGVSASADRMSGQELIARAAASYESGDHAEARQLALAALPALQGEHAVGALLLVGRAHRNLGDYDEAEAAFREAAGRTRDLPEGPDNARLRVYALEALGALRGAQGRYR